MDDFQIFFLSQCITLWCTEYNYTGMSYLTTLLAMSNCRVLLASAGFLRRFLLHGASCSLLFVACCRRAVCSSLPFAGVLQHAKQRLEPVWLIILSPEFPVCLLQDSHAYTQGRRRKISYQNRGPMLRDFTPNVGVIFRSQHCSVALPSFCLFGWGRGC